MSSLKISKSQLELIERLGVVTERSGFQPAAARIMALLMVSDRTELTFDEIQQTLGMSKSTISVSINLLLNLHRIEYITKAGDRKRYFRSKIMNWKEDVKKRMEGMTEMDALVKEVLAQRPKTTKEFNNTLAELIDFMAFLHKEIPAIFKKWEAKNK